MNHTISKIQSLFPNRKVCSIYNIRYTESDIVVIEDWTFFQYSTKYTFNAIVIITSLEDYIDWRRMLRSYNTQSTEIYIMFVNLTNNDKYMHVKNLIEHDKLSGIKFLK